MSSPGVAAATTTTSTTLPATPPPASAWVVVDVDTGRVLAANNDHTPLPPASLTKVLTALVATGWLPTDATVPVKADAATVYPDRVGMKVGQVWPLDEVMHSLLIFSANDAAYALADRISGSPANFGPVMSQAAAQLGLVDHPVLHDPAGLDGTEGVDGGNRISAWDLAVAGRALLAQPYLAGIVDTRQYSFVDPGGITHQFPNKNLAFLDAEPGAIGLKTGFTDPAGLCLMGAATQNGRTMMVVILHGTNPTLTAQVLLQKAFATPTAAEPTADALPPVVAPHKPAPPPTTTTSTTTIAPASLARQVAAPAPAPGAAGTAVPEPWTASAAAAVAVVVVGLATAGTWRRRRHQQRHLPAHRRRA